MKKKNKMFNGRALFIATKHQKERVIAPILEKEFDVACFTDKNFDSDQLGTFTGEIERTDDPITTAKNKCLLGMQLTNCELVLSSEGSFGMHPSLFFSTANDEILYFMDRKNELEIVVRELSTATNFNNREIKTLDELIEFAEEAKFPSHALIIRKNKTDFTTIKKGISDWLTLLNAFHLLKKNTDSIFIETDMRAMFNPTRMKVIEKATHKLVHLINSKCPNCNTPGFGITSSKTGLPCALCNAPTQSIYSHFFTCKKCNFIKEEKYPIGKTKEDPMYCDKCNP